MSDKMQMQTYSFDETAYLGMQEVHNHNDLRSS